MHISQFFKQTDWAQMKNRNDNHIYWKVKELHFRIHNRLVTNMNPKIYLEESKSTCPRCLPFSWRHSWMLSAKLLITFAHSSWNHRSDRCLQCSKDMRLPWPLVDVVLQENLSLVWKYVEIELLSVSSLKNLKRIALLCKVWFHYIWTNILKW